MRKHRVDASPMATEADSKVASPGLDESLHPPAQVFQSSTPVNSNQDYSQAEAQAVLRKIDWRIIPLMCAIVMLQFLDKSCLNQAHLLGVQQDLSMSGHEYSWLGSIFYFGYLGAQPIHGVCLQSFSISKYAALNVVLWGITLLCHAAVQTFSGIAAARFWLGFFEGAVTPSFIILTARFYSRQEQIARTGLWFSMNGVAAMIASLISFGLLSRAEVQSGLNLWQQLFIILGALTVAFGLFLAVFTPSSPLQASFLNGRERQVADLRVAESSSSPTEYGFKRQQLVEALKDPRLYLFFLVELTGCVVNGVIPFGTTITASFGFDRKKTALLGLATGAPEIVGVAIGVLIARKTHSRLLPAVLSQLVAIIGLALMIGLPPSNKGGRMAGFSIFFFSVVSAFIYSWIQCSIAGNTKRIAFTVALQLGYGAGNIIGPQTFREQDAPSYIPAKVTSLVMLLLVCILLSLIGLIHARWNRQRQVLEDAGDLPSGQRLDLGYARLDRQTDVNIPMAHVKAAWRPVQQPLFGPNHGMQDLPLGVQLPTCQLPPQHHGEMATLLVVSNTAPSSSHPSIVQLSTALNKTAGRPGFGIASSA